MKKIIKKYWYVFIIIILFIFLVIYDNRKVEVEATSIVDEKEIVEEVSTLFVDIKGEVVNPGVYELENNKRVIDAINIAGGLTKNADTSLINLSKKLVDEMNIKIYSKEEVESAKVALTPTIVEVIKEVEKECNCPEEDSCDNNNDALIDTLININTATKEELLTIPKIGETKADNIISYRKENKFNSIEDIKNVSGIGEALFESIKSYITV